MNLHGIEIPNRILEAIRDNRLVIFAGAGASMGAPTSLPSFKKLIQEIGRGTYNEIGNKSEDEYLGDLEKESVQVHKKVAEKFGSSDLKPNDYHRALVKLFGRRNRLRIVTTNYDDMFEKVCDEEGFDTVVYSQPALPYGNDFEGIVHIHGKASDARNIVITDKDFAKVYMYNSNISKFLLDLFNSEYVILFVGYSYNDLIMRYFTRAIDDINQNNRFIFIEEKLIDSISNLGIIPIKYKNDKHEEPYLAIEQLVNFVNRDALSWESRITEISNINPSFIDKRTEDELHHILKDIHLSDKLMKNINSLGWLIYFNYKGYLENLFSNSVLNDFDYIFGKWLIRNFIHNEFEEFKYLCVKHDFILNIQFQKMIIDEFERFDERRKMEILSFIEIEKMDREILIILLKNTTDNQFKYRIVKTLFKFKYEYRKLSNFMEENSKNKDVEISARIEIGKDDLIALWKWIELPSNAYIRLFRYMADQVLDLYAKKNLGRIDGNFSNYLLFTDGLIKSEMDAYIWIMSQIISENMEEISHWVKENLESDVQIFRRLSSVSAIQRDCDLDILSRDITKFERWEIIKLLSENESVAGEFDELSNFVQISNIQDAREMMSSNFEGLLNYRDINGDRDKFLKDMSDYSYDEIEFFEEIGSKLKTTENYHSEIWPYILKGASSRRSLFKDLDRIFQIIDDDNLIKAQPFSISLFVKRVVETANIEELKGKEDMIMSLVKRLWLRAENFGQHDSIAWNDMTFSSSYGVLSYALIKLIQKFYENGKNIDSYFDTLEDFLNTKNSNDAKFVIIGNFSLLYDIDRKWTLQKLLPYLSDTRKDIFQIAWRGFLTFSRLYPELLEIFREKFDYALMKIDDIAKSGTFRNKFIRNYTSLMLGTSLDPISTFIPKIFKLNSLDIKSFYKEIISHAEIIGLEAKEKIANSWVNEFINNRINNIPNKIREKEIEYLVKLILALQIEDEVVMSLPRFKDQKFDYLLELDFENNISNKAKSTLNVFTYITNVLVGQRSQTPNEIVLKLIGEVTKTYSAYVDELPSDLIYNFKILDI